MCIQDVLDIINKNDGKWMSLEQIHKEANKLHSISKDTIQQNLRSLRDQKTILYTYGETKNGKDRFIYKKKPTYYNQNNLLGRNKSRDLEIQIWPTKHNTIILHNNAPNSRHSKQHNKPNNSRQYTYISTTNNIIQPHKIHETKIRIRQHNQ